MHKYRRLFLLLPFITMLCHSTLQATSSMLDNKYALNTESELSNNYSAKINEFWDDHAQFVTFESIHGGIINTVRIKGGHANAIVLSQGRNESVLKYKEVAFDLSQQGYDIFLIDHRGQGFSSRLGGDAHRGHVQAFEHYIDDLTTFVDSLQLTHQYQSSFIVAHSMGGAINALYLQKQQHPFQAAAFFSPMFSINLGGIPPFLAKTITYTSDLVCAWFSPLACYSPGAHAYTATPFEENQLTSSSKRYASAFHSFETMPDTQLGGASMRWVNESLSASEKAVTDAAKIEIPIILLQSGADSIVTSTGQQHFFDNSRQCNNSQLVHIAGAKHELFLEQDKYRIPALTAMLDFFKPFQEGSKTTCIK